MLFGLVIEVDQGFWYGIEGIGREDNYVARVTDLFSWQEQRFTAAALSLVINARSFCVTMRALEFSLFP